MSDLSYLNTLIDKASEIVGNDAQLGKQLGFSRQKISDFRAGRQTATPEDQAILAAIAGLDPLQTLARAMVEKHEGTPKGDMLMRALGKALLVTGAVIGSSGASAAVIYGSTFSTASTWLEILLATMYKLKHAGKRRRLHFIRSVEC